MTFVWFLNHYKSLLYCFFTRKKCVNSTLLWLWERAHTNTKKYLIFMQWFIVPLSKIITVCEPEAFACLVTAFVTSSHMFRVRIPFTFLTGWPGFTSYFGLKTVYIKYSEFFGSINRNCFFVKHSSGVPKSFSFDLISTTETSEN